MATARKPAWFGDMPDDRLGSAAVSLAVAELRWVPDVAPAVMDRISRDAVAYPEHFDRRVAGVPSLPPLVPERPSAGRVVGRLAVFGLILLVLAGLAFFTATANGTDQAVDEVACLPIRAIDGRLVTCSTQPVLTEAT